MSAVPSQKSAKTAVDESAPEFDVLPPEFKRGAGARAGVAGLSEETISRFVAYLMDNLVKIPGTKARVGINPFLDLIPVLGDGAAMLVSAATIFEGARRRVPRVVLARMVLNILLNGVIGTIPGVGEVFAFWFRPTSRNYQLLTQHTPAPGTPHRPPTWREWAFVFGMVALLLIVLGAFFAIGVYLIMLLGHALFGTGAPAH